MVSELCSGFQKDPKKVKLTWMAWTIMGAVLRRSEAEGLEKGDWDRGRRELHIHNDKRNNARSKATKANDFHKPVFHHEAVMALDILERITPEGTRYFGFEREVKQFPLKSKAYQSLVWDGVHTLRHGGVNWLRENNPQREAAQSGSGHVRRNVPTLWEVQCTAYAGNAPEKETLQGGIRRIPSRTIGKGY